MKPHQANAPMPLIDRDLGWLQFNERVLSESRNMENPPLERAKFLSISSSNLDEFFMIRFASVSRSVSLAHRSGDRDLVAELESLRLDILKQIARTRTRQAAFLSEIVKELAPLGVRIVQRDETDKEVLAIGRSIFDELVLPKIPAPELFTPAKLRTLGSPQIAVVFQAGIWIPIPKSTPAAFTRPLPEGGVGIYFLDDLLMLYAGKAANLTGIPAIYRVIRDGDVILDLEEEDNESIPGIVRSEISSRERGRAVRLQYTGNVPKVLLQASAAALKLDPQQMFPAPHTLCLHGLWPVINQLPASVRDDPKLSFPPYRPPIPRPLRKTGIFGTLKQRDVLLHHPYDSFDGFVSWIKTACEDSAVVSIQMTIYRTDATSPIMASLKRAAISGKKVRVIIELRARFDELNNLRLAEELRSAGVEVCFGFGKLKLHAKVALVERRETSGIQTYTHLSTGNYHATTARQYTDLAILTAHPDIGEDARIFFDRVAQGKIPTSFKRVVPAPGKLHRRLLSLIEGEIKSAKDGKPARIFAKVNALIDESIISALYRASEAGVLIDLVVRGACSLVPGVPGLSENIRVISIIDRYLEHSRIYYFESSATMYFSSADWMPRNFFSRLEIAYPILDSRIYRFVIDTLIPTYLGDTARAKQLTAAGAWKPQDPRPEAPQLRAQHYLQELAARQYQGTALE